MKKKHYMTLDSINNLKLAQKKMVYQNKLIHHLQAVIGSKMSGDANAALADNQIIDVRT